MEMRGSLHFHPTVIHLHAQAERRAAARSPKLRMRCAGVTASQRSVVFANSFPPPFLHNWCQTVIPEQSDVRAAARGDSTTGTCVNVWIYCT